MMHNLYTIYIYIHMHLHAMYIFYARQFFESRWLEERNRETERKENRKKRKKKEKKNEERKKRKKTEERKEERKRGKARTRVESSHHRKLSRPMRLCKCYATPIGQLVLYTSEAYELMQFCGGGARYLFPHCTVALHPSYHGLLS